MQVAPLNFCTTNSTTDKEYYDNVEIFMAVKNTVGSPLLRWTGDYLKIWFIG